MAESRLHTNRIGWVDTAKALGVLLVITGHLLYSTRYRALLQLIYSFHMPLFFVLSGYVFRVRREERLIPFLCKKADRLLVPTFWFVWGLWPVLRYLYRRSPTVGVEAVEGLFFVKGLVLYNDPCWFFIVLFEVYVAAFLLLRRSDSVRFRLALCGLSFAAAYLIYHVGRNHSLYFGNEWPVSFGLDRAMPALGFFLAGNAARQAESAPKRLPPAWKPVLAVCGGLLWVVLAMRANGKVSMYQLVLGHSYIFIATGLLGSLTFCLLCQGVTRLADGHPFLKKSVSWLTENSVLIIGTHYVAIRLYVELLLRLRLYRQDVYDVLLVPLVAGMLAAYVPVCYAVNRWLPFVVCRRRLPSPPDRAL